MSDWKPFWTEEVTIENGGRYPLLLNRFHDHLEEYLIKGVVSVTNRLRYISYCCWVIGDIETTLDCKEYYEFEEAFRRREGALAIGTHLLKPETAMGNYTTYGREVMRGVVEDVNKTYKTSFKILPSNNLGAYGQYYKGTIQNWGLTFVDEDGIVRLTELGRKLYEIMDRTYVGNEYYSKHRGENLVSGEILYDWARINQYDNITDKYHKEERDFYKSILFHLDTKEPTDGRRDSLVIYLECLNELESRGCEFDENYMRNILYYKRYVDYDGNIHKYQVSSFLEDTRFVWMIYEMQVYFRWWISEVFKGFLRLISGSSNGLTMEQILSSIDKEAFNKIISSYLELSDNYFDMKFGDFLQLVEDFNYNTERFIEDELCWDSWEHKFSGFSEISAGLLMTISLLNLKFHMIQDESKYINIRMKLLEDFWFKDILEIINGLLDKKVESVIKVILNQFVIRQHNNAMYEKKDLRRCWFTMSGDKYIYQADSSSIWRPAKHDIICNFLYDMGLMKIKGDTFLITEEGRDLYKKLKDDYYERQYY